MKLKFRAWDLSDEVMYKVHGINFDCNGIWTKEIFDDEDDGRFISFDGVKLMQSTGRIDSNGIEIFEGDVVELRTMLLPWVNVCIVKKGKGFFYLENKFDRETMLISDFYCKAYTNTINITVLGNIYEHRHIWEK